MFYVSLNILSNVFVIFLQSFYSVACNRKPLTAFLILTRNVLPLVAKDDARGKLPVFSKYTTFIILY